MTQIQTGTAYTILEQLGGRRFVFMTGAKALTLAPESLRFRLPGGGGFCKGGINAVTITLTHRDDYDLAFSRVTKRGATVVATREGIYADQLQDVFTSVTGLVTSLGTMGRR